MRQNGPRIKKRLKLAEEYLKSVGCKEIILFGSLANGMADKFSDIDLAVSGISPDIYFKSLAEISSVVGWKVDLVSMDYISADFKESIQKHGRCLYAR